MPVRSVAVERFSVVTSKPFTDVIAVLDREIGRPDYPALSKQLVATKSYAELETLIHGVVSANDLMEFLRLDIGGVLAKANGPGTKKSYRLIVGNPLIMKQMAEQVPDAGSYAPITILVDERDDGVHLSYDRMASLLAPYGNAKALQVARDLDAKVERVLNKAAS
jgi:uncharacterized protein (DUF302 family)